jgi:hypothetical protein
MFYTPGSAGILAGRDAGAPRYKIPVYLSSSVLTIPVFYILIYKTPEENPGWY